MPFEADGKGVAGAIEWALIRARAGTQLVPFADFRAMADRVD